MFPIVAALVVVSSCTRQPSREVARDNVVEPPLIVETPEIPKVIEEAPPKEPLPDAAWWRERRAEILRYQRGKGLGSASAIDGNSQQVRDWAEQIRPHLAAAICSDVESIRFDAANTASYLSWSQVNSKGPLNNTLFPDTSRESLFGEDINRVMLETFQTQTFPLHDGPARVLMFGCQPTSLASVARAWPGMSSYSRRYAVDLAEYWGPGIDGTAEVLVLALTTTPANERDFSFNKIHSFLVFTAWNQGRPVRWESDNSMLRDLVRMEASFPLWWSRRLPRGQLPFTESQCEAILIAALEYLEWAWTDEEESQRTHSTAEHIVYALSSRVPSQFERSTAALERIRESYTDSTRRGMYTMALREIAAWQAFEDDPSENERPRYQDFAHGADFRPE